MGCSASRLEDLLTKYTEDPSSSPSSNFLDLSTALSSSYHSSPHLVQRRALSLLTPLVHHPPLKKGDTHHLVSLTSTTYGSLRLSDAKSQSPITKSRELSDHSHRRSMSETQVQEDHGDFDDFLSPDSVINTWELMDGLDDSYFDPAKPLSKCDSLVNDRRVEFASKPVSCRHTDFDGPVKRLCDSLDSVKTFDMVVEDSTLQTKPLWKHLSEEALLAKLDPNVVYSYRRALSSRHLGGNHNQAQTGRPEIPASIVNLIHMDRNWLPKGGDDRILLYFTSLRGIRKTYEDCCAVRMIFKGFRVHVDERDISMDSSYRNELQSALGGKPLSLPQVFIGAKHVGGAEEIKQLNEAGGLAKLLEGFPTRDSRLVCETCGDARFVPCSSCDGSTKIFDEDEGQTRRCLDCNENGLIRCYGCCP